MRPTRKATTSGRSQLFKEGLDEFPNASGRYYNIACMLALLGRRDDAIENLRRAVDIDPDAYKPAEDSDFESLKDDPEFLAIAGQTDAARASA